jgi:hypothetical protein
MPLVCRAKRFARPNIPPASCQEGNRELKRMRRLLLVTQDSLFAAEAAYADSMVCSPLGVGRSCIDALGRSSQSMPTYAPALLSLGTVEY